MPSLSQINRYPSGKPGMVKPAGMNELVDGLNTQGRHIEALWIQPPATTIPLITTYLFKPTANANRDGTYTGVLYKLYRDDFSPDSSGIVNASDIGGADDPSSSSSGAVYEAVAIGINIAEVGKTGHAVDVASDQSKVGYPCFLRSVNSDGRAVVLFWPVALERWVACTVSQTGGANGTQTSAPTYTYDVTPLYGRSTAVVPALSPQWARSNGKVNAATHGTAYWDDTGTLVLWQVDETRDTSGCT